MAIHFNMKDRNSIQTSQYQFSRWNLVQDPLLVWERIVAYCKPLSTDFLLFSEVISPQSGRDTDASLLLRSSTQLRAVGSTRVQTAALYCLYDQQHSESPSRVSRYNEEHAVSHPYGWTCTGRSKSTKVWTVTCHRHWAPCAMPRAFGVNSHIPHIGKLRTCHLPAAPAQRIEKLDSCCVGAEKLRMHEPDPQRLGAAIII